MLVRALVATRDARVHPDLRVRAAMKRIACDETRHAALAWSLAAWLHPRLDARSRGRVLEARRAAARDLIASTGDRAAAALMNALGSAP